MGVSPIEQFAYDGLVYFGEIVLESVRLAMARKEYQSVRQRMFLLVVEDYEPFRRLICSMLEKRAELQVIGEASDGLEGVRKAEELQPDLILLDVGLPTVNGLEAARRMRNLSPRSRIIFVSQESSADVVQSAFRLGAAGYVVKTQATNELLAAVDAVSRGERFISAVVAGHLPTELESLADSRPARSSYRN